MSSGLIGRKVGMTGMYAPDGQYLPITVIQVGPCTVTQVKTKARDGYNALQLGFDEAPEHRFTKPLQGHFRKSGEAYFRHIKEFRVDNPEDFTPGQKIIADIFQQGERVDVSGVTKGRGFSGVVKRYGFHGGKQTHGSKTHRIPGSIGCSAWPSRVLKGKKLPGRYGTDNQTVRNLLVFDMRPEENLLLLRGAVPGHANGLVTVRKPKKTRRPAAAKA